MLIISSLRIWLTQRVNNKLRPPLSTMFFHMLFHRPLPPFSLHATFFICSNLSTQVDQPEGTICFHTIRYSYCNLQLCPPPTHPQIIGKLWHHPPASLTPPPTTTTLFPCFCKPVHTLNHVPCSPDTRRSLQTLQPSESLQEIKVGRWILGFRIWVFAHLHYNQRFLGSFLLGTDREERKL